MQGWMGRHDVAGVRRLDLLVQNNPHAKQLRWALWALAGCIVVLLSRAVWGLLGPVPSVLAEFDLWARVGGLLALAYIGMALVGPSTLAQRRQRHIAIEETQALGKGAAVHIVRVDGTRLLVGQSAGQLSVLRELPDSDPSSRSAPDDRTVKV